jgi:hypothetical protein
VRWRLARTARADREGRRRRNRIALGEIRVTGRQRYSASRRQRVTIRHPGCAGRGARVVYREHGKERSFGIASLISWRGVWYVVHLGAVQRTGVTGIVDQPTAGPGVPGPPGGC